MWLFVPLNSLPAELRSSRIWAKNKSRHLKQRTDFLNKVSKNQIHLSIYAFLERGNYSSSHFAYNVPPGFPCISQESMAEKETGVSQQRYQSSGVLGELGAERISESHRPILPLHHDSSTGVYCAQRIESRLEERVIFYPAPQSGRAGKPQFRAIVSS